MPAENLEEYLRNCQEARRTEAAAEAKKRQQQQVMQDPSFLESAQSERCCKSSSGLRGGVLRFAALCLLALLILCGVYALRTDEKAGAAISVDHLYAVGDPVFGRDLWIVIELPSDDRGRRTRLGRQMADHVCSAIKAGQHVGWTPLVVGGRSTCCRSSRCRHLHPSDLPKMNHSSPMHLWRNKDDLRSAMRAAAFLAAIKRGAIFIFQANTEVYFLSGVNASTYRTELERQLRKMTIGISVGLVKQSPQEASGRKYHFDPYTHFRPADADENGSGDDDNDIMHRYKICEVRPPSIEKFLDTDGFSLDASAPAVTMPANEIASPFDSRNTMFGRDVFWSLVPLPMKSSEEEDYDYYDLSKEISEEEYVVRSIVAQAVMAKVAGSTKFNIAVTPTSGHVKENSRLSAASRHLLEYAQDWQCPPTARQSALGCLREFVRRAAGEGLLSEDAVYVADLWINDIQHVGYNDIVVPSSSSSLAATSPCIGDDLQGVYFSPAVQHGWDTARRKSKFIDSFSAETESPALTEPTPYENKQLSARAIQRLCPSVDLRNSGQRLKSLGDVYDDVLLIVTFNRAEYHNIPLFEVIYRHHFKNMLYCGEPDPVVDEYMSQYLGLQGSHFSFLPARSKTGYECLLGAIEMGYEVEGYMIVTHDTLINSWNFRGLDGSSVWHGNEHVRNISSDNIVDIDPRGEKVMKSTMGILHALEFLEDALFNENNHHKNDHVVHNQHHHQHQQSHPHPQDINGRRARRATTAQKRDLSMGVYDFLSGDGGGGDVAEGERFQRSEQQERILPQHEQHAHPIVQVTKVLQKSKDESGAHQRQRHYFPMEDDDEEGVEEDDDDGDDDDDDEKMMQDNDMMSIMNEEDDMEGHGLHLSLFGEIVDEKVDHGNASSPDRNVTELLFHPANLRYSSLAEEGTENMTADQYRDLISKMNDIYRRIGDKLNSWRNKDHDGTIKCDSTANTEICNLVADFFVTLDWSEGEDFHLFYDDLPIYYVPSKYKDKLYLMANLFTKFHVADELAFPLLLRGLSPAWAWTDLVRAEIPKEREKEVIDSPQDLLHFDFDEVHNAEVAALESAHYIYPVNMQTVLRNEDMKNVICRNF